MAEFMKNGVLLEIHALDCTLTMFLPIRFILILVNPHYGALIFLSTGKAFNSGSRGFSLCRMFCFRKVTGLTVSTGIFLFTLLSSFKSNNTSFFVSRPFSSLMVLKFSTE